MILSSRISVWGAPTAVLIIIVIVIMNIINIINILIIITIIIVINYIIIIITNIWIIITFVITTAIIPSPLQDLVLIMMVLLIGIIMKIIPETLIYRKFIYRCLHAADSYYIKNVETNSHCEWLCRTATTIIIIKTININIIEAITDIIITNSWMLMKNGNHIETTGHTGRGCVMSSKQNGLIVRVKFFSSSPFG